MGDKIIKANGQYAGKDYFKIFSFPMIAGDRFKALDDKNSIVISEDLSNRLFNTTQNVIGRGIKLQQDKVFFVTGIYGLPPHSSQQFDFVQSFDYLATIPGQEWVKTWGGGAAHIILLR